MGGGAPRAWVGPPRKPLAACAQDGRLADAVLLLRKLAAGDASVLSTTRLLSECHDADSYGSRRMIAQHAAQHAARRRDAY